MFTALICRRLRLQMTVDALSMELPKLVVKFVGVSDECGKYVERIIDYLITTCNPRDMLSMLCEASSQLERFMHFLFLGTSDLFTYLMTDNA